MALAEESTGSSPQWRLRLVADAGEWPVQWVHTGSFPNSRSVHELVALGGERNVLILQKVLPGAADMDALRSAYQRIIFDLDTAIYASPTELGSPRLIHAAKQARRIFLRGRPNASSRRRPLARVLREVDLCIAGNSELETFASRFARRTVVIPTTIEPLREAPRSRPQPPVVVWMGHPDSLQYLELIREPLVDVAREVEFHLRIVSTRSWANAPLPVEFVEWTWSANREALASSTLGISPLPDDPWNRGRSASRLVHYGGHGLPAVASPVGVSGKVLLHGRTGFLASSPTEWTEALLRLLCDSELVAEMGREALTNVSRNYSDAVAREHWRGVLGATSGETP